MQLGKSYQIIENEKVGNKVVDLTIEEQGARMRFIRGESYCQSKLESQLNIKNKIELEKNHEIEIKSSRYK